MAITIENIPNTGNIKIISGGFTTVTHHEGLEYGSTATTSEYWLRIRSGGPDFLIGKSTISANIPTINGVSCGTLTLFHTEMEAALAVAEAAGAGGTATASGETITASLIPQISISFQDDVNPKRITTAKDAGGYGTITRTGGMLTLNSGGDPGVDPPGYASFNTRDIITLQPGQTIEAVFYFAMQGADAESEALIGLDNGTLAADPQTGDGVFLAYRGLDFGLYVKKNGTFTPYLKADWNVDKADGAGLLPVLDPYYLNKYKLTVSHGSGVLLSIAGTGGEFFPAHHIEWSNLTDTPFALNWAFKISAITDNRYGVAPVGETVIKIVEAAAYHVGELPTTGRRLTLTQYLGGIGSTETVILNTYNNPVFSGDTNLRRARIESISFGCTVVAGAANGPFMLRVYRSTTIPGGVPAFTAVSATTSIMETDTAGTLSATAADCIAAIGTGDSGSSVWVPQTPEYQLPGEYLTLTGIVPVASGTAKVYAIINLIEE